MPANRHYGYSQAHRCRIIEREFQQVVRELRPYVNNHGVQNLNDAVNAIEANVNEGMRNDVPLANEEDEQFMNWDEVHDSSNEERNDVPLANEEDEQFMNWDEVHDSSSEESDGEDGGREILNADRLQCNLRTWAIRDRVNRASVSRLLGIMRNENVLKFLPRDVRTLLNTPRQAQTVEMENGKYCHFGIEEGVRYVLSNCTPNRLPDRITLFINIDGLPLVKSSKSQLWPILGSISNTDYRKPFIIGAYHGYGKPPSPDVFLQRFVEDAENLRDNGIRISDNVTVPFETACFICDAPARAYICCARGHSAYHGCGKCETRGQYAGGSVVFPEIGATLRTAESFRNQTQPRHHTAVSPLLRINNDLVCNVPFDYMHIILLGVVRKILNKFVGKVNPMKLSARQVNEISTRMLSLRRHIPCEFSRKPRGLRDLDRMKATEFRQFLIYTGMVVLRKIVAVDVYVNFLHLALATRILVKPDVTFEENRLAKEWLNQFIREFTRLYGIENVTYNVHGLQHVPDDAMRWGALDDYSAFPFENYLQDIKKNIKKNDRPLEQLMNRVMEEREWTASTTRAPAAGIRLGKLVTDGPLVGDCSGPMYAMVQIDSFTIKRSEPNNYCILDDETVVRVDNICSLNDSTVVVAKVMRMIRPFFEQPLTSTCFGIIECTKPQGPHCVFPLTAIRRKAVVLPMFVDCVERDDRVVVIPFIHERNS